MTTITIQRPARVAVPRAAPLAAELAFRLLSAVEQLVTRRRARRIEADRTAEAAAVRRYADEVRAMDPRFAADLCAAADRHELG